MSATSATGPVTITPGTDTGLPPNIWESHTARCTARWGRSGAVISVEGELDAANSGQLADYLRHCADYCDWLVLDLDDLEFIGTAGFSILQTMSARCTKGAVYLALVPGVALSRLLQVCDPDSSLPTVESVADALVKVQDRQHSPWGSARLR